jgi:DNA-binding NarL/FixJ family response regulator
MRPVRVAEPQGNATRFKPERNGDGILESFIPICYRSRLTQSKWLGQFCSFARVNPRAIQQARGNFKGVASRFPVPSWSALLPSRWGVDMSANRNPAPVHIGLVSDEFIRLEGLVSIFDQPPAEGHALLVPITGTLAEMLSRASLEYMLIDMHASPDGLAILDTIRRARPSLRLIVIGPEGDDELVMESIIAGARAYLDLTADIPTVRQAIEVVTSGSIWAPRRLLSKLIDRLLKIPDSSLTNAAPRLTAREKEVLHLILQARSNREIARQLGIEERTVKAHVGRLMRKTGADNRIELSMRMLTHPLEPETSPGTHAETQGREASEPTQNSLLK